MCVCVEGHRAPHNGLLKDCTHSDLGLCSPGVLPSVKWEICGPLAPFSCVQEVLVW